MALTDDLRRAVEAAVRHAGTGEELSGVIAAEPAAGVRLYLCSYTSGDRRTWLAIDDAGHAVGNRSRVRDAVSIAALCELAEESAAGGDLDELAARLAEIRFSEAPEGIEEAEEALAALRDEVGDGVRVASPERLDRIGEATRRLEVALGEAAGSPFAEAMRAALPSVEALTRDVEGHYKRSLE